MPTTLPIPHTPKSITAYSSCRELGGCFPDTPGFGHMRIWACRTRAGYTRVQGWAPRTRAGHPRVQGSASRIRAGLPGMQGRILRTRDRHPGDRDRQTFTPGSASRAWD